MVVFFSLTITDNSCWELNIQIHTLSYTYWAHIFFSKVVMVETEALKYLVDLAEEAKLSYTAISTL